MKKILFVTLRAANAAFALFAAPLFAANEMTAVRFTSSPAGATVVVDGRKDASLRETPTPTISVSPGRHRVKFLLDGYQTEDLAFDAPVGVVTVIDGELHEEKGLLLVKTVPDDCEVSVDGASVGRSPCFVSHLSAGDRHVVRLTKNGYQPKSVTVNFEGRTPYVCSETLVLDSGLINLVTDPAGAEVMLNGRVVGTTPLEDISVPKGTSIVKFTCAGFQTETRQIRVAAGDRQTLSVSLNGRPGLLELVAEPADATFYVNDEVRGRGRISVTGLAPGDYLVRCARDGYETVVRTITVGRGETKREEFKLESVMGRIELRTSPVGAELLLDGRPVGHTTSTAGDESPVSDVFVIRDIPAGDHTLVVRKSGYHERSSAVHVEAKGSTSFPKVVLKRAFIPNYEVTTINEVIQGVLLRKDATTVVIERSPGSEYPIPRSIIRSERVLLAK